MYMLLLSPQGCSGACEGLLRRGCAHLNPSVQWQQSKGAAVVQWGGDTGGAGTGAVPEASGGGHRENQPVQRVGMLPSPCSGCMGQMSCSVGAGGCAERPVWAGVV